MTFTSAGSMVIRHTSTRCPPSELGAKYVEAIGGADKVLEVAKVSYAKGEYRWVATLLDNLVFAEPENKEARQLLADTYTQLGYQAESGPWRNFYLTGARDLFKKDVPYTSQLINDGVLAQMDMGTLLAYIIHSGFISGYQNRYGDNLKPPTNVYHRMTA